LCLYFMGLNLSNEQIAHELSINESDAYQMTTELRGGIVKKRLYRSWCGGMIQICGDGSQFAVLLGLHDRT